MIENSWIYVEWVTLSGNNYIFGLCQEPFIIIALGTIDGATQPRRTYTLGVCFEESGIWLAGLENRARWALRILLMCKYKSTFVFHASTYQHNITFSHEGTFSYFSIKILSVNKTLSKGQKLPMDKNIPGKHIWRYRWPFLGTLLILRRGLVIKTGTHWRSLECWSQRLSSKRGNICSNKAGSDTSIDGKPLLDSTSS